jgi:hypothetical protein
MIKTLLTRILLVIGVTFGAIGISTMSSAEEIQILDIITDKQLEELDIEIPEETPFGYNELIIDVYEDNDVVVSKRIGFCKEADGFINWNNECQGPITEDVEPQVVAIPKSLLQDQDVSYISFLVLAVLAIFGALVSSLSGQTVVFTPSRVTGSLATSLRELAKSVSGSSPLFARIADDGAWLRARVGHLTIALYVASAGVAMMGLFDTNNQALPLATIWTVVLILIGSLDALAALYASLIYFLVILTNGGISSSTDMVVILLFVLLVALVRPLAQLTVEGFSGRSDRRTFSATFSTKVALLSGLMAYFALELSSLVLSGDAELIVDAAWITAIIFVAAFFRTLSSTTEQDPEPSDEVVKQLGIKRGRVLDVAVATVLTITLMKFFLSGTSVLWPTLFVLAILGLLGIRRAARQG